MTRSQSFYALCFASTLALPSYVFGCGAPLQQEAVVSTATAENETPTVVAPSSPWDRVSLPESIDIVRNGALARIREAEPSFDVNLLAHYRTHLDQAPVLQDRVAEQLLSMAIADLAAGDEASCIATIRMVRAKAANRNLAFAGTLPLLVAHASQSDDAMVAVLTELPTSRFGSTIMPIRMFREPSQIEASLEQIHTRTIGPETCADDLRVRFVLGNIANNHARYDRLATRAQEAVQARPALAEFPFDNVDLGGARDAREVRIAVWDSGIATHLFEPQLFTNEREISNGVDDDGNGLIDDIHGLIDDADPNQTTFLYVPSETVLRDYTPFLRGVMELRAGLNASEGAQQVMARVSQISTAEELEALNDGLAQVSEWAHGTHVAGIALAGIPQAKLAVFRSGWVGETRTYRHRGPTDAELMHEQQNVEAIGNFVRAHHIQIVNLSLGFSFDHLESELRYERALYPTDAVVRARARQVLEHRRNSLANFFASCPDTLFVAAAGNTNHDILEYPQIPASLVSPNLVVVGAVDSKGEWAPFTNSNAERVRIFDLGVNVDSVIPSGERVPFSGTSMSAPQITNLAAKILSVSPRLSPARVIQLMEQNSQRVLAPYNGVVPNERRAVARARRTRR